MPINTPPEASCPFCRFLAGEDEYVVVAENQLCVAFVNEKQYERGAMLVVPRTHRETILDIEDEEIASVYRLAKRLAGAAVRGLAASGVSVFQNNGVKSGQTVAHYHVHVVPRYESSNPQKNFRVGDLDPTPLELQRSVAEVIRAAL